MDGGRCDPIWTGIDFSECFQERYLSKSPYAIVTFFAIYLLTTRLYRYRKSQQPRVQLTPSLLTAEKGGKGDLATLEATVLLSAVGTNLLDISHASEKLSPLEAAEVVEEYRKPNASVARWESIYYWVGLVGSIGYLCVGLVRTTLLRGSLGSIWGLAFPIFLPIVALLPSAPLPTLMTFHLIPCFISLRTRLIRGNITPMEIIPTAYESLFWIVLCSIPYADKMDFILSDCVARGGGSLGSYGQKLPAHIEQPTSVFSRTTHWFTLPFLIKHWWHPLKLSEIPALREDDSSSSVFAAFRANQAYWDRRYAERNGGKKRPRNLGLNLIRFFWRDLIIQSAWSVIFVCFQYLPPLGLRLLLQFISNRATTNTPDHVAYLYIGLMVAGQTLGVVAMSQSLWQGRRLCIRLRAIIIPEVFTKALRRRDFAGSIKTTTTDKDGKITVEETSGASDGKVANLVSNDVFNVSEICAYTFYLVECPTAIIINSLLLYSTLGPASFAGIGVILLLIPLQGWIGKLYAVMQRRLMGATDARLEAVTEVISHIKLIKFNAWEDKFFSRMSVSRSKELRYLAQKFVFAILLQVVVWGTPVIVTAVAFAVHSLVLHQPLTADRAFSSLILFNMLKDPIALFQDTFVRLLQAYTSCSRAQAYIEEPDTLKYEQLSRAKPGESKIGFKGALVSYASQNDMDEAEFEPFTLGKLDIEFPEKALSIIVGPVGSGKTTLIMSLLGETILLEGRIYMPDDHANRDICPVDPATGLSDTVAYCSQTPWLIGASIRENITFGTAWDKKRYDGVVDACALRKDFEIFELGDETEVGEKGTTCSGGQKARIALARALYSTASTIILDDVLSAVDAQTARHLYTQCLQGPLAQNRTIILVTHAVSLVAPAASLVIMLDAGHVMATGSPSDLISNGMLEVIEEQDTSAATSSATLTPEMPAETIEAELDGSDLEVLEAKKSVDAKVAAKAAKIDPDASHLDKRLVAAEAQRTGSVGWETYSLYLRSMGGLFFWVVLWVTLLGAQMLQVANNAWIKDWANATSTTASTKAYAAWTYMTQGHDTMWYLLIYIALSAAYMVAVALRCGINYLGSLYASRKLYDALLKRILGAKMRFFDSTPSGRIINRLSQDIFQIDNAAGEIIMYFLNCVLSVASALLVVIFTTPQFLFALVFIVGLYVVVGSLYIATNREIKRHDSVTRSPIFISFSEVLVGMSTIRSYGDSARFMRKLLDELDQNTRCFWYMWQINRILQNLSNFGGAIVTIAASVFALKNKSMDAGAVGLSISYALSFTDFAIWIVRMYAASEMTMNSVERVGEYLELDVEEPDGHKGVEPPAYWPSREGSVVVENLTCKYAPQLEPVLRGVSFEIGPREKIGICGRTGSGKSTLALSFFRFLHQEGGSIIIDGLDLSRLSLATLRSRLTILPQEAQLFSGSIRENLDPFNEHEDADIWDALSRCGLSGKTPFASRAPTRPASRGNTRPSSRNASRVDLKRAAAKAAAVEADLRSIALQNDLDNLANKAESNITPATTAIGADAPPQVIAADLNIDDGDDEVVEERVVIRSLDEKVAVGGKNFSQGQRQLLALARGLLKLRTSSFLIMDESTANLDHATDQTIQHVLRTGLQDVQMLVIAHRLMTVCGLDKILVLDHGKVVEFGTPWELMQKDNGSFRELCKQSGEESQLFELAKSVHEERHRSGRGRDSVEH